MSLKTILIGLNILRCGIERSESVHGRPSWELAPYRRNAVVVVVVVNSFIKTSYITVQS